MSQLVSPSEALNQAFVLPKVSVDLSQTSVTAQVHTSVFAGYGIAVGNINLSTLPKESPVFFGDFGARG